MAARRLRSKKASGPNPALGLLKKFGAFALNALLALAVLVLCVVALEGALRTGWFDGLEKPHADWKPARYKRMDKEIERANDAVAKQHPFGFVDRVRPMNKPAGYRRIVVMGDSFVWGDGLPYDQIWSHKLEKLMVNHFRHLEVMSWGIRGWSTLGQLEFLLDLHRNRIDYGIDLLIVGFVTNDPDVGRVKQKYFEWQNADWLKPVADRVPNAHSFLTAHINRFLSRYVLRDLDYSRWQDGLYTEENLGEYGKVLEKFALVARTKGMRLLFVLTPNNYDPKFRDMFDKVLPLFEEAGIEVLDLYPAVVGQLSDVPLRKLQANPVNGHPGPRVTELYAQEVFRYLDKSGMFDDRRRF